MKLLLLNAPRLVTAGGAEHVLERKDAALLAALAIDGPSSREKLSALLWPDSEAAQGRTNLRQRLFRLRRAVGHAVVIEQPLLLLDPHVAVDLHEAEHRHDEPEAALGLLLGTHEYDEHEELSAWVHAMRERWRRRTQDRMAARASVLEARGELAAALRLAHRLVDLDPLHEHAHRRLIRLHYLRGDRSAALTAYAQCRDLLRNELQTEPGHETLQLGALIASATPFVAAGPAPQPVSTLRPPRLVGREAAWQTLATARIALVTGEPGIGKSRLLGDFASGVHGVEAVGARPGDANLPYALLARLLRSMESAWGMPATRWARQELGRVVPGIGEAVATPLSPVRLQQAVLDALVHCQSRGMRAVAIDDLQFADEASLELLLPLVGDAPLAGLRWLLASRERELPPSVAAWWGQANLPPEMERVRLEPLEPSGVGTLLDALALPGLEREAWADALASHTGGNPLFLLETLRAMLGGPTPLRPVVGYKLPTPRRVAGLIAQRLDQLSPEALRLARVVAVAGQDFSATLASHVMGQPALGIAEVWGELEAAQVIRGEAFTHDLVGEATLAHLPAALGRLVHADVAVYLQRHGAPPAHVAEHWRHAEDWPQAAAWYLSAASVARRAADRRLEADLAEAAAQCFVSAGDPVGSFDAWVVAFHGRQLTDSFSHQAERASRLLAMAARPMQRLVALEARALVLVNDFQDEVLAPLAHEARELAQDLGDGTREVKLAAFEARALARRNRIHEALALVHHYLPAASAWPSGTDRAHALGEFACALITCDRTREAVPLLAQAFTTAADQNDLGLCQYLLAHQAWADVYLGDVHAAVESYERGRALAPRLGATRKPAGLVDAHLARFYKELGRLDAALQLLDETLAELADSPSYQLKPECEAELADVQLWLGRPDRAMTALGAPDKSVSAPLRRVQLVQLARIRRRQGLDPRPMLEEALALSLHEGGLQRRCFVELELALCLPPDEAAHLALAAAGRCRAVGLGQFEVPLQMAACDALRRCGQLPEATAMAGSIRPMLLLRPLAVLYTPEAWWMLHQVFVAAGDQTQATATIQRATAWIDAACDRLHPGQRADFLNRNQVNRAVLRAADRMGP